MAANYYWGMWGTTNRDALRSTCPPAPPPPEPSWEEQAFARDAAGGHLGTGCVWPPRSYSCTFCRREFRSAQALGGHMNVHRRDRARLRQCASPPDHQPVQPATASPPHLQPDHSDSPAATPLSRPKSPAKDQQAAAVIISPTASPSYTSPVIKESKSKVFISMPEASTSTARKLAAAESRDAEEERTTTKRRRVVVNLIPPPLFFVRSHAPSCERSDGDAKVIPSPSSAASLPHVVGRQEVDLELRLGISPPKVA